MAALCKVLVKPCMKVASMTNACQLLTGSYMDYQMPLGANVPNFQAWFSPLLPCPSKSVGHEGLW